MGVYACADPVSHNKMLSDRVHLWPCQTVVPHTQYYTVDQNQPKAEEIKELPSKGVIVEMVNPQGGFYSNLFLITKKGWHVINMKSLVQTKHFKMEGIHILKDLQWIAKEDLKDTYFGVPIHHSISPSIRTSRGSVISCTASHLAHHQHFGSLP